MNKMIRTLQLISLLSLTSSSLVLADPSVSGAEQVNIIWGDLTRPRSLELVEGELKKPISGVSPATTNVFSILEINGQNPFFISRSKVHEGDFYVGDFLPEPGTPRGVIPPVPEKDAAWFDTLVKNNTLPKVFVIGGHQVISEGWHNDEESAFLFLPSLLKTIVHHPAAQKVFESVKVAILFGCNTMTNLEPHGKHGEYMTPAEIKARYYSGEAGKREVIGSADEPNTLEFYRARLAREYGPDMGDHYEYTRDPSKEKCSGPHPFENCAITYLDRILPDEGLFDGYHDYNYPMKMKMVFPNAKIILGFSSASPAEEVRERILAATIKDTYQDVNTWLSRNHINGYGKTIDNILYPLLNETAPEELQREIVASLRKNWTIETYNRNASWGANKNLLAHRPSGSVSSVFADLENGSILGATFADITSHQYGPYLPKPGFKQQDDPFVPPYLTIPSK